MSQQRSVGVSCQSPPQCPWINSKTPRGEPTALAAAHDSIARLLRKRQVSNEVGFATTLPLCPAWDFGETPGQTSRPPASVLPGCNHQTDGLSRWTPTSCWIRVVPSLFRELLTRDTPSIHRTSTSPRGPIPWKCTHQRCVQRKLCSSKQGKAIRHNFETSSIRALQMLQIKITDHDVGCDSAPLPLGKSSPACSPKQTLAAPELQPSRTQHGGGH